MSTSTGSGFGHLYPWQVVTRAAGLALSVKLDTPVDVERLRRDARAVLDRFQLRAQHGGYHDGGWKAVGLVAANGDVADDRASSKPYLPTPALDHAPYIGEIVQRFGADMGRVRILSLAPGENIHWHFDTSESVDLKYMRFHIPIWTNPGVRFQISHEDQRWQPGEVWYGEFSFPHRLVNQGAEPRLHLVFDLKSDERTRTLLPPSYMAQSPKRARFRPVAQTLCTGYELAELRHPRVRGIAQRLHLRRAA